MKGHNPGLHLTSWESPFPQNFASPHAEILRRRLSQFAEPLQPGLPYHLPRITLFPRLKTALVIGFRDGALLRGLEACRKHLETERAGLENLAARNPDAAPRRISRVILLSNDGSDRFYRHVHTLLKYHAPRLAGLVLDHSAEDLSKQLFGSAGQIKALLTTHKNAVQLVIQSLLSMT